MTVPADSVISRNDFFVTYQPIDLHGDGLGFVATADQARSIMASNENITRGNLWKIAPLDGDVYLVPAPPAIQDGAHYVFTEQSWEIGDENVRWVDGWRGFSVFTDQ